MSFRGGRFAAVVATVLGLAFATAPQAYAAPPADVPPESYLYVIDASNIKVVPSDSGKRAKVILLDAKVTRFSDRPYRHQLRISLDEMHREFERDAKTQRWGDPTPNAGVSVAGQRTEIVDIQRSSGDKNRLILHVKDVHRTLTPVSGTGAVFIDNVTAYPVTQQMVIDTSWGSYYTAIANSATSVTISSYFKNAQVGSVTLTKGAGAATITGPVIVDTGSVQTMSVSVVAVFGTSGITVKAFRYGANGSLVTVGSLAF